MNSTYNCLLAIGNLLALVCLCSIWRIISASRRKSANLAPEPSGAWPVLGHLGLFRGKIPIFRILGDLADDHGPVFQIRLGIRRAIVVSSWESVKECFRTNDRVFLTRPSSAASKYMGYDNALFGLAPYGPYWLEVRKMVQQELLSNRRLEQMKHVRVSEVETCIKELYEACTSDRTGLDNVDISQWFSHVAMNVMVQMIAGKRYCGGFSIDEESERFRKAMREFFFLSGEFVVSDITPFIEWMDLQGHVKSMKRVAKELDYFLSNWLQEHLQSWDAAKEKDQHHLIDVMLSSLAAGDVSISGHRRETIIKATALNLILAGADSTSVTLTWALSLLLTHNDVLKRAQAELDIHVGTERWVQESDLKNLVYLQAIVKETLRLYPPGPLLAPREALEDCHVDGYYVPRGTRLIVNAWKLHRDSRIWPNPYEFQPERFLTSHAVMDGRGQHFQYIPFSSGRRVCPGISSGLQMTNFTLARLLQGFNFATPMNAPVDMTEGLGLIMPKAKPLRVILTPRLEDDIYC